MVHVLQGTDRNPFNEGKVCTTKVILKLIAANICESMKTISFSSARSLLLCVDDLLRKCGHTS